MKRNLLSSTITRILFVIMLCLPAWNSMQAKDPEAYAVLDKETCTLTFKYDTERPKGAYKLNKEDRLGYKRHVSDVKHEPHQESSV